jgi:hypothetical protein
MKLLEALLQVEGDGKRSWSLFAGDVLLQCDVSATTGLPAFVTCLYAVPLTEDLARSESTEIEYQASDLDLGAALRNLVESGRKELVFGDEWTIIENLPVRPFL